MLFQQICAVIILSFCVAVSAQRCSLGCGPGYECALVRRGRGPPIMDCITFAEARLLEQAYQGGPIGMGLGGRMFGGGGFPGRRFRGGSRFHGGVGIVPSTGVGILPDVGLDRPNIGVVNPGGVGPAIVDDRSRGLQLNINVQNNNENQHSHTGSGGVQVSSAGRGSAGVIPGVVGGPGIGPGFGPGMGPGVGPCMPCQSPFDCPSQQCVFSSSCGNVNTCVL